jgi:hypothetical protein
MLLLPKDMVCPIMTHMKQEKAVGDRSFRDAFVDEMLGNIRISL